MSRFGDGLAKAKERFKARHAARKESAAAKAAKVAKTKDSRAKGDTRRKTSQLKRAYASGGFAGFGKAASGTKGTQKGRSDRDESVKSRVAAAQKGKEARKAAGSERRAEGAAKRGAKKEKTAAAAAAIAKRRASRIDKRGKTRGH